MQFNLTFTVTFWAEERGRCRYNRELKEQGRQRRQKRHLKSGFALVQTLSRLFDTVQFIKCWQIFLEVNSKRLYRGSRKKGK